MLTRLRTTLFAALAILCLMPVAGLRAQSCVLCYTSLANAGPNGIRAFQIAMFVLLIPTLLLFVGLFLLVYHRRAVAEPEPARTEAPLAPAPRASKTWAFAHRPLAPRSM
jgi:hypothetical protein